MAIEHKFFWSRRRDRDEETNPQDGDSGAVRPLYAVTLRTQGLHVREMPALSVQDGGGSHGQEGQENIFWGWVWNGIARVNFYFVHGPGGGGRITA